MIAIFPGENLAIQWKKSSNIGIWSATLHENSPDGSLRRSYQWRVDFMNNSLDLFVSAFMRKNGVPCSIPICSRMFLSTAWSHGCLFPENCWSSTKRQGPTSTMWRHGPGDWTRHLSCRWLGKRCWCLQRYGWCDMAEEMVASEDNVDRWGLLKNPESSGICKVYTRRFSFFLTGEGNRSADVYFMNFCYISVQHQPSQTCAS